MIDTLIADIGRINEIECRFYTDIWEWLEVNDLCLHVWDYTNNHVFYTVENVQYSKGSICLSDWYNLLDDYKFSRGTECVRILDNGKGRNAKIEKKQ